MPKLYFFRWLLVCGFIVLTPNATALSAPRVEGAPKTNFTRQTRQVRTQNKEISYTPTTTVAINVTSTNNFYTTSTPLKVTTHQYTTSGSPIHHSTEMRDGERATSTPQLSLQDFVFQAAVSSTVSNVTSTKKDTTAVSTTAAHLQPISPIAVASSTATSDKPTSVAATHTRRNVSSAQTTSTHSSFIQDTRTLSAAHTTATVTTSTSTTLSLTTARTDTIEHPRTSVRRRTAVDEQPKSAYGMLRIHEVAFAQTSGHASVKIVSLDAGNTIPLERCELRDERGRILIIRSGELDPPKKTSIKLDIPAEKLRSGSGTISLHAPDGRLIDTMQYSGTHRGDVWVREEYGAGSWNKLTSRSPIDTQPPEQTLTAFAAASLNPMAMETTVSSSPVLAENISKTKRKKTSQDVSLTTHVEPAAMQAPERLMGEFLALLIEKLEAGRSHTKPQTLTKISTHASEQDISERTSTDDMEEDEAPEKKSTRASRQRTQKATKKRARIQSNHSSSKPFTFDMLTHESSYPIRVQLTGRVSSPPGLLPRHSFVLQASDGRGLLVTVPIRSRLPHFQSEVAVAGSLWVDDGGTPNLKMAARDIWSRLPTSTQPVTPRVVDLIAPAAEDAWSLVAVTGTVASVKGSMIQLDLEDADLEVVVKTGLKYRTKRLVPGDVIAVTGLLDTSRDTARLLPRHADEIVIVKHAPPKTGSMAATTQHTGTTLPTWAPIGAAAGAIGVTEAAKHLHRKRKRRTLEKKLVAHRP